MCIHDIVSRVSLRKRKWYCVDCGLQFMPFYLDVSTGKITKRLKRKT